MTQTLSSETMGLQHPYKYIRYADQYFEITPKGEASVFASIKASAMADKVGATVFLQRYDGDWTTIKKWDVEKTGFYCSLHGSIEVDTKSEYRIEVFFSASHGDYIEDMVSIQN
jgi:hypothetical protein